MLLIRGEPGLGKTSLWGAGIECARSAGTATLAARSFDAEMPLPFAALLDLLEPVVDDVGQLPEPQRVALNSALGRSEPARAPPDRLAVARAVLGLLSIRADEGPLIVAVDDVQWLDPASARVLSYLARRLEQLPVGLLLTERAPFAAPAGMARSPLVQDARTAVLELKPLPVEALGRLLRERAGLVVTGGRLRRLHDASAGNPFYALEFARAASAHLRLPPSLRELAAERIAGLPRTIMPVLEMVSVVGKASTSLLTTLLAKDKAGVTQLELALDLGVLTVDRDVVSFSHPLLARAVHEGLSPPRRRLLHRRMSQVVTGAERARHLALATVVAGREVADLIEQESAALAGRGAPDEAAELALHAQRLTPAEDGEQRQRRGLQAVRFLLHAGEVTSAIATLEPLLAADSATHALRAETLVVRADAEWENRARLVQFLAEAAAIAPDEATRSRVHLRLAWHAVVGGDLEAAARSASCALRAGTAARVPFLIEAATVLDAHIATLRGRPAQLEMTDVSTGEEPMPPWHRTRRLAVACHRLWAGELVDARRLLLEERHALVSAGQLLRIPFVLLWLADVEWRAGEWARVEHYAAEGASILDDAGSNGRLIMGYLHALLAAAKGDADIARTLTGAALARADTQHDALASFRNRWIRAELELSLDDPLAARRELDGLPQLLREGGFHQPAIFPILPAAVEAAASLGLVDEAASLCAQLAADAAATRGAWAAAATAHARAHVHLARAEHDDAAGASARAAAAFARIGFPLDHARALLTLGRAAHRGGRRLEARHALTAAGEGFLGLGATAWRERADAEARRISGRRGSRDQLTGAEQRVAELVGEGLTNKEVAARLYTTVATVESHLTRIYRKSDVRSRSELARRRGEQQPGRHHA